MNIGTISTSFITDEFIMALKEEGSFTLTAVYSRTEESATNFAKKNDAPHSFTDIQAMATSDVIDCVYVASPNAMHFEHTILFLKNKKHVICEKPIFSNVAELNQAYQVAKENNVFLFEAMRNIPVPGIIALEENLHKCGTIRSATLNYAKYSSRYTQVLEGEEPNIFSLKFSGGALADLGVYPLTAAIALFGKPLNSSYFPVKIRTGVDGAGTLILQYPTFTCTILCSKISTTYNPSEIQGEDGTFIINDMGAFSKVSYKANHTDEENVLINGYEHHDMLFEIKSFHDIMKTNNQKEYEKLQEISETVLEITEKSRKENDIIYAADQ